MRIANHLINFITVVICLNPLSIQSQPDSTLTLNCNRLWMQNMDSLANPVDFQSFGQKYCDCVTRGTLVHHVINFEVSRQCFSKTLLLNVLDSIENEIGLTESTQQDVNGYCQNTWTLLYPKQTEEHKKTTIDFCQCATPEIMTWKSSTKNLEKEKFNLNVEKIADYCANTLSNNSTSFIPSIPKIK